MANLTPEDIAELRNAAEAATPEPWVWWTSNSWRRLKHDDRGRTINVLEPIVCSDGHPDCFVNSYDMDFIALARTLVPRLLAELESAQRFKADADLLVHLHALAIEEGYMPDPGESAYDLLQRSIQTKSPKAALAARQLRLQSQLARLVLGDPTKVVGGSTLPAPPSDEAGR